MWKGMFNPICGIKLARRIHLTTSGNHVFRSHFIFLCGHNIKYSHIQARNRPMARTAPGRHYRRGLTLPDVADRFSDNDKARAWLAELRWPNGPHCPFCGSCHVQSNLRHKTMTHRCRDCDDSPMFSMRHGTILAETRTACRKWAIAIYLYSTNLKGISRQKISADGLPAATQWK